ncbi:MAG TPA: alkane 1-monooxygenase, partial [Psychrobacter sp.]|nr:alkane 1-monooxygenase [Psychrobacter sp.]
MSNPIPLSFLDLAPVPEGKSITEGIAQTVETAQQAEKSGLNRYWMAEHHNMPGIASAATSVLLSHIGAQTKRIRIGAGGVMLPNHAPIVIAEQFGTLQALYGDRVDLGLGRAPGTDGATFQALRRQMQDADRFPQDVQELMYFLGNGTDDSPVQAFPGAKSNVPIWILGSSLFGATLAAHLGLPYVFASHFAPQMLGQAITAYREQFRPSAYLEKPYVMLAANLLLADDDATAQYHFTSAQQSFVRLRRGETGQMPKPTHD